MSSGPGARRPNGGTDWGRYGYCYECDAREGQACWDKRFKNMFHVDKPHRLRAFRHAAAVSDETGAPT